MFLLLLAALMKKIKPRSGGTTTAQQTNVSTSSFVATMVFFFLQCFSFSSGESSPRGVVFLRRLTEMAGAANELLLFLFLRRFKYRLG